MRSAAMRAGHPRRPVIRAGLLAAALASVTAGCSGLAPQPGPGPRLPGLGATVPCPGQPGFRCGHLTVRLDPSGAAPGWLSLPVALSDAAAAPRGVLVALSGGPGEPGVPFATRLASRLGPALRGYRLVLLDQRGTGAAALNCPALQHEMGASDLTVPTAATVRRCATAIGPNRRFFGTADTVADLDALRRALGVSRLALDGISYGSYVAEQFALAHPRRVSRLILDSVVPARNVDPLQLAGLRRTATVLRAVCAQQGCSADPARDLAAVVRRYHDGPQLFDTLVAMSVGAPSFPGVPAALHAAADGQPAALRALIGRVHAADAATAAELSQGLHAATLCADLRMPWGGPDTPLARRRAALDRATARLTPAQVWPFDRATAAGNGFVQTCLYWPPAPALPAAPAPRARLPRVPVLLLAGGRDLSTPLSGARAQAALAPDGRLLIVPAAGHSVQNRAAGNPARAAVGKFLASR
jgi:pimeloyl-ACP methyl ester carboxylesterase